jgi:UDP-perosamine 4-acetyltransferase
VIGAGGHAKVLVDCLLRQGIRTLGFIERNAELRGTRVCGLPVLGGEAELASHAPDTVLLVNAVGSTRTLASRRAVFESLKQKGYEFLTIVHPSVVLGAGVGLAEGAQVMAGAILQPDVTVGKNSIVNTGALIDHDTVIGSHVHVSPGCVLSGGIRVGDGTHLGAGATVIQGISIGARCLVAAGSVVIRDVPDDAEVMGVPAAERRR